MTAERGEEKKRRAAIYIRLSREDGDKEESDSVVNQRELIRAFLQERPESILTILTMSFVDYYRAAAVRRAGVADATARKELGYGGSYRFTKALEQCGRLSRPALEGSLEILADADARMKQSAADGRTVLEVTILRLIELLRRERA